jgi:glycosyltransferase involved in cell wall biosynthesis
MARAASSLCRALAARGHEVTVVTARLDPAHPAREDLSGVRVHRVAGPEFLTRRLVPWAPALGSLVDEVSPDVAHVHGHRSGLAVSATRALARRGVPWVLQPHGTFPHHGQHRLAKRVFDGVLARNVARGATRWIAVSEAERRDLPHASELVPNGVVSPGVADGVARDPRRLLFVGTDAPQKRGLRLAEVLRLVEGVRLSLVGRGSAALRDALGHPRVEAHGVLFGEALAAAYAGAALVLHPARDEAFGLVPFEAALYGTAAVVAGGHGCGEWYARAGGCVVAAGDEAAFAAAVVARLAEPRLAQEEAVRVEGFVRRELSWDSAAQRLEPVYAEAARRSPQAVAR